MMRAEFRGLHRPDVPNLDLEHFTPEDPECFCVLVQAFVGPQGEPGEEAFDFTVCTPRWLNSHPAQKGFLFARHYLLLWRYDYDLLRRAITDLCARAKGPDWETVANRLARYGHWEFEDYQAFKEPRS